MATDPPAGSGSLLDRYRDFILPTGIIASVLVIIVPLPSPVMDLLLSVNITVAVIVLLTTIYVKTPLEFNIFPSLLLATTLGRLVLNVATTRLILTRAETEGLHAAGGVIQSFGDFVAGDRVVVGLIIFVIVVLIQFVVITKGATRISEVAARFALDGMPGRQMAIDADLNAGIIDEREAQTRRQEITDQADFYGAMDGASKFVRGDAIAGIVITLINIVGGLIIGMGQGGMSATEAGSLFTKLTIGDGLVSQIPAFLISLAAGLLVTRSTQSSNLPREFLTQLFSRPQALFVSGGFLAILVFTNLPTIPLVLIGGSCVSLAVLLTNKEKQQQIAEAEAAEAEEAEPVEERVEDYLIVDPMEMEIGVGLIRLADPNRGGDLLDRVQRVRQNIAAEMGVLIPKVRIRDNVRLDQDQYRIKISDMVVASDRVQSNMLLAIDSGLATGQIDGFETLDPAFGTRAFWIDPLRRDRAEMLGYTVVEPSSVLATHLTEIVRKHADEILTRDATKHLIDELKETQPTVVEELIPNTMKLAEVQQILQMLLREQVPIRQLGPILETLGDYAPRTKDPVLLTEYVRHRLARTICTKYRDRDGKLHVATLEPALEDRIKAGLEHTEAGLFVRMSPQAVEHTCGLISEATASLTRAGHAAVILVSPQIRAGLKKMTEPHLPQLIVLSYNEITRDTQIESAAMATDRPAT
ncbi:MAG: flagellar biosynthesis protein FlhA [Planctomycetota bacterium]|nr:MAG: flagellar biosynthesis protein FlhA [Planctomycetota bacterium]REJ93171.1 MAG: flagellar biosynthesis protein FlhA [Planctomycetota bacterium]